MSKISIRFFDNKEVRAVEILNPLEVVENENDNKIEQEVNQIRLGIYEKTKDMTQA